VRFWAGFVCVPGNAAACQTMNEYHTGASQTLEAAQLICREKRGVKLNTEVVHWPSQSCTHDDMIVCTALSPGRAHT